MVQKVCHQPPSPLLKSIWRKFQVAKRNPGKKNCVLGPSHNSKNATKPQLPNPKKNFWGEEPGKIQVVEGLNGTMPTSDLPIGFLSGFFGWLSQKRIHGTNGERYIYLLIYLFWNQPHSCRYIVYIYIIPMDPMAKKIACWGFITLRFESLKLGGIQSRKTQVPWKGSGSWKPTALRAYHIFNCSGKFRLEARESPKRISMSLPSQLALLTLIYTVSHTSQQKSGMAKRQRRNPGTCAFPCRHFPEKHIHQNLIQLWDVVVSLPQKSIDLPYCPSFVPAATLHPRLRHILPTPTAEAPQGFKGSDAPTEKKKTKQCFLFVCEEQIPQIVQPYLPQKKYKEKQKNPPGMCWAAKQKWCLSAPPKILHGIQCWFVLFDGQPKRVVPNKFSCGKKDPKSRRETWEKRCFFKNSWQQMVLCNKEFPGGRV